MESLDESTSQARVPGRKPPRRRHSRKAAPRPTRKRAQRLKAKPAEAPSPEAAPKVLVHCIFYIRDSRTYVACAQQAFSRARDQKQHFSKHHRGPEYYCSTCNQVFETEEEWLAHELKAACTPPADGPKSLGLSRDQQAMIQKLRARPRAPITETTGEYWKVVFRNIPPPTSFVKVMRTRWEENAAGMRECWESRRQEVVAAIHGYVARLPRAVQGIEAVGAIADATVEALLSSHVDPGGAVGERAAAAVQRLLPELPAVEPWNLAAGSAAQAAQWPGFDEPQLFGGGLPSPADGGPELPAAQVAQLPGFDEPQLVGGGLPSFADGEPEFPAVQVAQWPGSAEPQLFGGGVPSSADGEPEFPAVQVAQWPGSAEPQLFGGGLPSSADGEPRRDASFDRGGQHRLDEVPPPTSPSMTGIDPSLELCHNLNDNFDLNPESSVLSPDFGLDDPLSPYPPVPLWYAQGGM